MQTLSSLAKYYSLADELISSATKAQLAKCAKLLALHAAHYAVRYGELPSEPATDYLSAESLNDEQAKMVTEGLRTFVGILGNVMNGYDATPLQ